MNERSGTIDLETRTDTTRAPPALSFQLERPIGVSSSSVASSAGLSAWQGDRVRTYIETQLGRPLPAIELATLVRLSASHFSRAFKVHFGSSPHAYVVQRRIERAKILMLSQKRLQLAEIAVICGLSDQPHLTKLFRRMVGETPKAWQRRNRCMAGSIRV